MTRLPGGALTPKRLLAENFVGLRGKVEAASYNQVFNKFYFVNDKGYLFRFRYVPNSNVYGVFPWSLTEEYNFETRI